MQCKRVIQCLGNIARSVAILSKVSHIDITFDIATIIRTTSLFQCDIWTIVNHTTFLELNLRAIINTRNTTESEHQCQVLSPNVLALIKTCTLWCTIWSIVVRIHIHHIPCSIVVVFIAVFHTKRFTSSAKVPVHWEVNHTQLRVLAIIRGMVSISLKKSVIRVRQ